MWFNSVMRDTDSQKEQQPGGRAKKPYTRPTLTEYGSVAKLTMTKGSTSTEISANKKKSCL